MTCITYITYITYSTPFTSSTSFTYFLHPVHNITSHNKTKRFHTTPHHTYLPTCLPTYLPPCRAVLCHAMPCHAYHTYIHTDTYIQTHTYRHIHTDTYIHIHTYRQTYIHTLIHCLIQWLRISKQLWYHVGRGSTGLLLCSGGMHVNIKTVAVV